MAYLLLVRVMIGRGIAFVTYKYEANAQFAKEAMMHQSLDHDEVLNVRWAAEDPRSDGEARDAHERRGLAEKRISEVENTRLALQDDYKELKNSDIDWEEYARAKRQRLNLSVEEKKRLDEENERGWDEYHASKKTLSTSTPGKAQALPPSLAKPSLLSVDALQSLHALRNRATIVDRTPSNDNEASKKKNSMALDGIAAYESDSD